MFFSPFSIAITSLWEERANLSAFRAFVRFVLVWICRFPLPLGVWEGLRFVIVALPGLFSYLFLRLCQTVNHKLGVYISGRSLVYFILFFIVFDYSQPVWMFAESRLDNNCSLVIAKCWRNGLLVGRDFKTQWTITANMAFSLRLSVKKMYFPIIISVKRKTCLTLRTRKPFPSSYTITI